MSDCNETLRELYAYLDDEMSTDERASVQNHLDHCMDCLQAFEFHAELRTVIAHKCHNDEVPPGLVDKIRSCFGEHALDVPEERGGSWSLQ